MFISKSKRSPFYQITYEIDGKRTTVSTKKTDLREAYIFMASFEPANNIPTKIQSKHIQFSKFVEEYVDLIQKTKSRNYTRSVKLAMKMLYQFHGDFYLRKFDVQMADRFVNEVFSRTPRGALLYYRTLKAAFSKAVLWNYISDNPFKKIRSPKVQKSFPTFLTETQLELILQVTSEEYLKDLFQVALYTGMRLGEIVNMKWGWIEISKNLIIIKCTEEFETKSKRERIIPMNTIVSGIIRNLFSKIHNDSKNDYVFNRIYRVKLNEDYVSKKFKKYVRLANLDENIHFHSLRHSFASLLVQRNVSLFVVKELLGHENLSTTQLYSHLHHQNIIDAINKI